MCFFFPPVLRIFCPPLRGVGSKALVEQRDIAAHLFNHSNRKTEEQTKYPPLPINYNTGQSHSWSSLFTSQLLHFGVFLFIFVLLQDRQMVIHFQIEEYIYTWLIFFFL